MIVCERKERGSNLECEAKANKTKTGMVGERVKVAAGAGGRDYGVHVGVSNHGSEEEDV